MTTTGIIILCIVLYLAVLVGLGLLAKKERKSDSLKDFYLAGSGLGTFVLLLTLYATQYSANTMLVTPAEVVSKGMGMILVLGYMTAIVIFYLTFAPQLYKTSRKFNFITPGDWFDHRFGSDTLTMFANIILVIVSINFLLSQLMAMGHITTGITEGQIPYWVGVVFLALVVLIYESVGGMRAVAWTDVIQGIMLLVGLSGIFFIVAPDTNELTKISNWLMEHEPQKIGVPSTEFRIYWASTIVMIGMGGAVYPQVIQRIYAAKSARVLRQALGAMVFMPLVTVLILFLLGVISIPHFVNHEHLVQDTVLPQMLRFWSEQSLIALALMVMVVVGLLAAIMSTADSVLLSLSSIFVKDILRKYFLKDVPEENLTHYGKVFSWIIMLVMIAIALQPRITLWGLIELKMQLLVQIAPLFLLGIHSNSVHAKGMLAGISIGFIFVLGTFLLGWKTLAGVQSGFIGFGLNILACFIFSKGYDQKSK